MVCTVAWNFCKDTKLEVVLSDRKLQKLKEVNFPMTISYLIIKIPKNIILRTLKELLKKLSTRIKREKQIVERRNYVLAYQKGNTP